MYSLSTPSRLISDTEMTGKQMILGFLNMRAVTAQGTSRTRFRTSVSFRKQNPKIATVTRSFSRDRIGSILSILIFTERLMKYSDMMEMTSPQDVSFFYSTVSAGNHMRSLVGRTGILSRRKVTVAANLESWRVLKRR